MNKVTSLVPMMLVLGGFACGGEPNAASHPGPADPPVAERPAAAAADEEPPAVPEPTPPPPPPDEDLEVADAPVVPGTPLTVRMGEIRPMEPDPTPTEVTGEAQAIEGGRIRIELTGYRTYCSPGPQLLAHVDGQTIRLFQAPQEGRSRCAQPFAVTLDVGPLAPGTYTIQAGTVTVGEVEVVRELYRERPERTLAVSQTREEGPAGGGRSVESVTEGAGVLRVSLRGAVSCAGPPLFVASRDGDRLVLYSHPTGTFARCASVVEPFTLLVYARDFRPTSVVLQDLEGTTVAELAVSLEGENTPAQ